VPERKGEGRKGERIYFASPEHYPFNTFRKGEDGMGNTGRERGAEGGKSPYLLHEVATQISRGEKKTGKGGSETTVVEKG